ncbi:MAG TPA: ATP-binding cassette domain-containing protein, partial [Acidimicrobiia bacterium]|nr:ATP-binding cassette domain-containing protein [Acidimicrobiia bacterium]
HRYGLPIPNRRTKATVDRAIAAVEAQQFADAPIGVLSGGEQQRLRVAQAIVGDPQVLLCDEPLLSLDLAHQRGVSQLINGQRERSNAAVVFVTHEINPILPFVDRVLYLVGGRWAIGTPDEVLTSETLSALYDTTVDVLRIRDRIVVVGSDETTPTEPHGDHHHIHDRSHGPSRSRRPR